MIGTVGYYLNFGQQADPVPVAIGGSRWRKGCEKFPSMDSREGHGGLRTAVSLRLVQSRVVSAEWKPVDERGIDGQPTRWQTAASSQLYNLHASRKTNGTYTVPQYPKSVESENSGFKHQISLET